MAKLMPEAELQPLPGDEFLSPDDLLKISIFDGLKAANLERFPGAVRLRLYKRGQVICRQGEPGWTAFYILTSEDLLAIRESKPQSASADDVISLRKRVDQLRAADSSSADAAFTDAPRTSVGAEALRVRASVSLSIPSRTARRRSTDGLVRRMLVRWLGTGQRKLERSQAYIPIDGPVDVNYENPIAELHEGELFGEMSCINRYPRSATVRASHDCYMIEMLRNVLELLQKNKAFKDRMDAVYRQRSLDSHLRSLPLFKTVSPDMLVELANRVELVVKEPGEVIFSEGDPSDSIYIIRVGMVKVTRSAPGGESVLAYLGRGECIGEMGVLLGEPRSATCMAVDHPVLEGARKRRSGRVELVRIVKEDVEALCARSPDVRKTLEGIVAERKDRTRTERAAGAEATVPAVIQSKRFDELGLVQGRNLMLIDLDKCTRCDECVRACADTHEDGRTRLLREGPRFGHYLIPSSCRQCRDPVCMIGCPVGSIHKGAGGEIVIEDWCIGCEICAKQCPYDSINMHDLSAGGDAGSNSGAAMPSHAESGDTVDVTSRAVVCDQCSSLADGIPSCVYACPHDAAIRVDAVDFFSTQAPRA